MLSFIQNYIGLCAILNVSYFVASLAVEESRVIQEMQNTIQVSVMCDMRMMIKIINRVSEESLLKNIITFVKTLTAECFLTSKKPNYA
jgi:hypothetical protein